MRRSGSKHQRENSKRSRASTERPQETPCFNASLGWLQIANDAHFAADSGELRGGAKNDGAAADLLLEQGLVQAAQQSQSRQFVKQFRARFSDEQTRFGSVGCIGRDCVPCIAATTGRSRCALEAGDGIASDPACARTRGLSQHLDRRNSPNADSGKIISLANQFLRDHPNSNFTRDVRMKLAETYYRAQDFANAQTQFELLATQDPNGPLAEKALFLRCRIGTGKHGIKFVRTRAGAFRRCSQKGRRIEMGSANEQAVIERKLSKPQDALAIYDEVLKGDAKPGEKREALCGKGDIYFEMGPSTPENYKRAIEIYDQLISDNDAPPHWKNQALFKKGVCLEKAGDAAASLAIFYRVLEDEGQAGQTARVFWYARRVQRSAIAGRTTEVGFCRRYLSKARGRRGCPERRSQGASRSVASGTFPLGAMAGLV